MSDPLEKISKLMKLAIDERGNIEERMNAALSAVKLMHKHSVRLVIEGSAEFPPPQPRPATVQGVSRAPTEPYVHVRPSSAADVEEQRRREVEELFRRAGWWGKEDLK